jgi:tetratricopeptide (TPR) repeat protein
MPPWKPEPGYEEFEGVRGLSTGEIATLQRWEAAGFPRGDQRDLPPRPQWNEWQLGPPDLVAAMPEPYVLEAGGSDVFRTFVISLPDGPARYVKAFELKPSSGSLHHANIKIDRTRSSRILDEQESGPGHQGGGSRKAEFPDGHFLGWTPGQSPRVSDEGTAWRLDGGSDLIVEAHLLPSKKTERVQIAIGLYFTDTPPSQLLFTLRLSRQNIDIAPGERVVLSDAFVLPVDVDVLSIQPHAHYLATEVRAFATPPNGTAKPLIVIKDWDFHWQDIYRFVRPVRLSRGTTLRLEYSYDNSAMNRRNPNRPPKRVTFGQTTASEMASLWLQVLPHSPRDRQILESQSAAKLLRDDIEGYMKMLELNAQDPRVHSALAHAYAEAGRIAEATEHFATAVRLDSTFTGHYDLATILLAARRWEDAERHFTEALTLRPRSAEAAFGLGVARHQAGRLGDAIKAYRAAIDAGWRYRDAHYNLARALATNGERAPAVAEYRRALELDPRDAEAHSGLGAVLAAENQIKDAVAHFRSALAIDPDLHSALIDLAWILATSDHAEIRDPAAAVRLAERAATLSGAENAVVLDTLAVAYAASGQLDRAIAIAESAERLARQSGQTDLAAGIRQRLAVYLRHRP